jgi:hypothetical protein
VVTETVINSQLPPEPRYARQNAEHDRRYAKDTEEGPSWDLLVRRVVDPAGLDQWLGKGVNRVNPIDSDRRSWTAGCAETAKPGVLAGLLDSPCGRKFSIRGVDIVGSVGASYDRLAD